MSSTSILTRFLALRDQFHTRHSASPLSQPPVPPTDLHHLWLHPERLPEALHHAPEVLHCLTLLGPLAWDQFPERDLQRNWGQPCTPYAALAAACLWKIDQHLPSLSHLYSYLVEHPGLAEVLGFRQPGVSFNAARSSFQPALPTFRHFPRLLHKLPNSCLQFLLTSSVQALLDELSLRQTLISEVVAVDTKHILAWVKENNPKVFIEEKRFDKTQQPAGDPDCKLGCKRKHNRRASSKEPPANTPTTNSVPADTIEIGEYYWGYASGVVALKVPGFGELVLAELTQPFDKPDVSYFFPLMTLTEQRLGHQPRCGALDAAFDAWYVYEYFHRNDDPEAFAAVPFAERGGIKSRTFSADGVPFCAANLLMPLKSTFTSRSGLFEHLTQRFACPLLYPKASGAACPIPHENFTKGGCTVTLPASIGSRLRYTLDRQAQRYTDAFKQRTAVERIFSQAKELGIERPMLRNGAAIANWNTLIYTLINLRLLARIRQQG